MIISLFNQTGWTVDKCENVSGSNWHINVHSESIDQGYKIDLFIGSIRDEDRKPDEFKMQLGSTYPSGQQKDICNSFLAYTHLQMNALLTI